MTIKMTSVVSLVFLATCTTDGPNKALADADAAIASGAFADAVAAADRGLAAKPSQATVRWRLELVRLEALARSGNGDATTKTLERLAATEKSPIRPSHYLSAAFQLRTAGQAKAGIGLLHQGLLRFSGNADLTKAIEQAKAQGGADELDALRSLGYLD